MEVEPNGFLDPEEDEIFFYAVTEKEKLMKSNPREEQPALEPEETEVRFDQNMQPSLNFTGNDKAPYNSSLKYCDTDKLLEMDRNTEGIEISYVDIREGNTIKNSSKSGSNELNKEFPDDHGQENKKDLSLLNKINESIQEGCKVSIYMDHNYSTPVKSVIDKSILRTPKSVVKADRDGGFLKVLSEIALVKAEADENSYKGAQQLFDNPLKVELGEDDKENSSENDVVIAVNNHKDQTPKVLPSQTIKRSDNEYDNDMDKCISHDKLNENYVDILNNSAGSFNNQQSLKNEYYNLRIEEENNEMQKEECHNFEMENNKKAEDLEIVFENLRSDSKIKNNSSPILVFNKPDKDIMVKSDDNSAAESLLPEKSIIIDDEEEHVLDLSTKLSENLIISSEPGQQTFEKNCEHEENDSSSKEQLQKRLFKRNTMRLLEELNEVVSSESAKKNSSNVNLNDVLSEEARKVVELIRAVGISDDSMISGDQNFDLDKINMSFLTNEMLDAFNDTLSRPINQLTNHDLELLLEKINSSIMDNVDEVKAVEMYECGKENLCDGKMTGFSFTAQTQEKESNSAIRQNFLQKMANTPIAENEKTTKKLPDKQLHKIMEPKVVQSERKPTKTPLGQKHFRENKYLGSQSTEKNLKMQATRIPKLTCSASKIPTYSASHTLRTIANKTPLQKAQKSLKFNNIESPVQAYINSRSPVLVSNIKAKSEPAFNMWMRHIDKLKSPKLNDKKNMRINTAKTNLPLVEYKSAIPLKLEKPSESRLPKLAPKMKTLIGDISPVVTKHEGRIHLSAPRRPQISMNDGCVVTDANEVSVLISKVAQKSNNFNK